MSSMRFRPFAKALRNRLPVQHPLRKLLAVLAIAGGCGAATLALRLLPGTADAMRRVDNLLYNATYRLRPREDRTNGDVVIVAFDQSSLEALKRQKIYWPVPRDYWGMTVELLQRCGAKVVAFDVLFEDPSGYAQFLDDDQDFARTLDTAQVPVVMAVTAHPSSAHGPFAVPATRTPIFGAVNLVTGTSVREYKPTVYGLPSLGTRVAEVLKVPPRDWALGPFRLHYYGPHAGPDGKPITYRYVPVWSVFKAASMRRRNPGATPEACGIDPALFRGKVVLIGYTATALYDLKSTPLSDLVPGTELHATAIDNLIHDQHVRVAGRPVTAAATFLAALLAAAGVALPRRAGFKMAGAVAAMGLFMVPVLAAFMAKEVHWLPLSAPLLAGLLAAAAAFEWTYLVEGRHRRQIVRAFSQVLSPELVAQIERNPRQLDPGGEKREMTVMFTDLADFTPLTESLDNHALVDLLNYYFDQMAPLVLAGRGTLDKYIGDSIMSFWNAPVPQPDHAALACRAALGMAERERAIRPELARRGAPGVKTRIGINTGPMIVGFTGSGERLNYSVLGDAVNLGSRLEGANKFYGSQILMSQSTAECVRDRFLVRKLDVLRVKGKRQPVAVYELLAEGRGDESLRRRAELYESALAAFHARQWDEAEARLNALQGEFPDDAPAVELARRTDELRRNPPPPDWDGAYTAKEK